MTSKTFCGTLLPSFLSAGTRVGSQMMNEINALLADQNRRAATSAIPPGHLERGACVSLLMLTLQLLSNQE